MTTWIALFRGINVGGRNILPMKELVRDLQSLGLEDVKTYIQSGNAVFRATERGRRRSGRRDRRRRSRSATVSGRRSCS